MPRPMEHGVGRPLEPLTVPTADCLSPTLATQHYSSDCSVGLLFAGSKAPGEALTGRMSYFSSFTWDVNVGTHRTHRPLHEFCRMHPDIISYSDNFQHILHLQHEFFFDCEAAISSAACYKFLQDQV